MMKDLVNKKVTVELGTHGPAESIKGTVMDVSEEWLKIESKSTVEYINLREVKRIIEKRTSSFLGN